MKNLVRFVICLTITVFVYGEQLNYNNWKIFKANISTEDQRDILIKLSKAGTIQFSNTPGTANTTRSLEIIVPSYSESNFRQICSEVDVKLDLLVANIQELIDSQKSNTRTIDYDLLNFNRLNEMYEWLDSLAVTYPTVVTRVKGGETYEKRTIEGVKLSRNPNNPGIFIEANIHGREWLSSATANWIINELLTSEDPEVSSLLDNFTWYIFPVTNPDGYEYTHTTDRLWRKTRSRNGLHGLKCWGTDPNRNFDFEWAAGGIGSSDDPCSQIFAGTAAFSEIETRTLSEYVRSIRSELSAYISFHTYAQLIMSPYALDKVAPHYADHMDILSSAHNRLVAVHGSTYYYGSTHYVLCKLPFDLLDTQLSM